jgi:hypothetical protein
MTFEDACKILDAKGYQWVDGEHAPELQGCRACCFNTSPTKCDTNPEKRILGAALGFPGQRWCNGDAINRPWVGHWIRHTICYPKD